MSNYLRRAGRALSRLSGAVALGALALSTSSCGPQSSGEGVVARTVRELESELWRQRAERAAEPRRGDPIELRLVVADLLATVATGNEDQRRAMDDEFSALGREAVPELTLRLEATDAPREERAAAARALAATGSAEAAEVLLQHVEDTAGAGQDDDWLRAQCALRLAAVRADWIQPRLLLRLRDENAPRVVIGIAEALRGQGSLAALTALQQLALEGEPRWRTQAAATLAQWTLDLDCTEEELAQLWNVGDPLNRLGANPPSLELRVDAWRRIDSLSNWEQQAAEDARHVLVHLTPWIQDALGRALADPDKELRTALAQVLEERGSRARECGPALRAALRDAAGSPELERAFGAALEATQAAVDDES